MSRDETLINARLKEIVTGKYVAHMCVPWGCHTLPSVQVECYFCTEDLALDAAVVPHIENLRLKPCCEFCVNAIVRIAEKTGQPIKERTVVDGRIVSVAKGRLHFDAIKNRN